MFDAWNLVGVGGGSAALTYIATNWRETGDVTLRLSLDKSGSLLGDVRFLGGVASWLVSMYTTGTTKKALQTVAAASIFSLVQTEIVRMRLAQRSGSIRIAKKLPLAPGVEFGALPGPGHSNQNAYAPQGAWANR